MTPKTVVLRETAEAEAQAVTDHYELEAGQDIALDFVSAYEAALKWIGAYPAAGSPRYAEAAGTAELRSRALDRFPYTIFYLEMENQVEVLHILHQHRDIPAILRRDEP